MTFPLLVAGTDQRSLSDGWPKTEPTSEDGATATLCRLASVGIAVTPRRPILTTATLRAREVSARSTPIARMSKTRVVAWGLRRRRKIKGRL